MSYIPPTDKSNPFKVRYRSLNAARTQLDAYTANRLKNLLLDPNFNASSLNLSRFTKAGRGYYFEDLELLIGDKLSQITDMPKLQLTSLYLEKMKPPVVEIYEEVLNGTRKNFPHRFWHGWQGKLNMIICFKYLLEQKLGVRMEESTRSIDSRLYRQNQREFLKNSCGFEDWINFMAHYSLGGGYTLTFKNSISDLMRACSPWAFNLNTGKGKHLHPDDFRQEGMWQDNKLVRRMIHHRLTKHLEIVMDESSKKFDPRLLRENQDALLAELGYNCWRDVFIAEGLGGFLASRPEFDAKPGKVLKWRYPWAFNWSKPEGEHLHAGDFEVQSVFTEAELKEALLHEIQQEGWQLQELPQKITKEWLATHGLSTMRELPKLELLNRCFPDEFAKGFFHEADFRNQDTTRCLKASSYRKIKNTNAGKTPYGIIYAEKTAIYFPAEYIGFFARKESSEHGVVYQVIKTFGALHKGRILRPVKIFLLPKNNPTYWRPELIDFSGENYPILPEPLREALVKYGIVPQSLSVSKQKNILNFKNEKGIERLAEFLQQFGYLIRRG